MPTDEWLDKASGRWLTGPEVEERGGLSGKVTGLGTEKMNDGTERPVVYVTIENRARIFAVNVTASNVIRAALKGQPSGALVGRTISFTSELARNPRTNMTGPAVRIARISGK